MTDPATPECSTFLGGRVGDGFGSVQANSDGIHIAGYTWLSGFVIRGEAAQSRGAGVHDAIYGVMSADCADLSYATYLGGTDNDFGRSVAVNRWNSVVTGGEAGSSDFPVTADAVQNEFAGGGRDGWFTVADLS